MNQPKVFIVHGFEGQPNGGWRPWLMGKLGREDIFACSLAMPTPEAPIKEEWIKKIGRAVGTPGENTYLVGHSLGVPAILQYLQSLPEGTKIGGVVLVSGPIRNVPYEHSHKMETFFHPEWDFPKIKNNCKNFVVIHGDNDIDVPFSDAEEFGRALSCEVIAIPNGGHLNGSSGWRELPQAFTALMNFLKSNLS